MQKVSERNSVQGQGDLPSTPFIDAAPDAFSGEGLKSLADLQICIVYGINLEVRETECGGKLLEIGETDTVVAANTVHRRLEKISLGLPD